MSYEFGPTQFAPFIDGPEATTMDEGIRKGIPPKYSNLPPFTGPMPDGTRKASRKAQKQGSANAGLDFSAIPAWGWAAIAVGAYFLLIKKGR